MTVLDEPPTDYDTHPGHQVPQDSAAEQAVLGAMLLNPGAVDDVEPVAAPQDFWQPKHEAIAKAIFWLHGRGEPCDTVAVADLLGKYNELGKAGGPAYLATLVGMVPTAANADYYAGIVAGKARLRRLVQAGTKIAQLGTASSGGDVDDIVNAARGEFEHATTATVSTSTAAPIGADFDDLISALAEPPRQDEAGCLWGWASVDMVLNPLTPGQLAVVGARPSVGKSTIVLDVARHVAVKQNRPVVVSTLEMERPVLQKKLLAAEAGVSLTRMNTHTLEGHDWDRIGHAKQRLRAAPLIIDDNPHQGITEIRALIRKHRPALFVLDYIQLARMTGSGRSGESRREALEQFTRDLKLTAKALQVPILAAAQLNRGPETRTDKRPVMSDFRESGSVENDADVILLLHRPDMYEKETLRAGEADLIVAKQRNGPTETIPLAAQLHYSRFTDLGLAHY